MAWRDSRLHRRKLALFTTSIILGTAALVAISSLGENLQQAVDDQSKSLLGADLLISSPRAFPDSIETFFADLDAAESRQVNFSSMLIFPNTDRTRLAALRALGGDYPWYGEFGTDPPSAASTFRSGQFALVDESLMIQYELNVGDSIGIGEAKFAIAGRLQRIPGEAAAASLIGPRVFIPLSYLDKTELIQPGSLASYHNYFKFGEGVDVDSLSEALRPFVQRNSLRMQTIASRRERIGDAMEDLYRFLNLVGFIAVLLGSIGVASAIHVHVKQKIGTIAVLHCIGASTRVTFMIFLIQAMAMGLFGALAGAALGIGVQYLLPLVLRDFLPVDLTLVISWGAVLRGILLAVAIALLFALLPLLRVRLVSPLIAIRASADAEHLPEGRSRWLIYAGIILSIFLFALRQSSGPLQAAGFVVSLLVAFALLAGMARLLMAALKRYLPVSWSYVWRQGIANLFRPNNQTIVMMVALGLGTFLVTTLHLSQTTLLQQVALNDLGNQPNLVMFDIQNDQRDGVKEILESNRVEVLEDVPIVTMRLASVKGEAVGNIQADSARGIPRWAVRREYRSSYRDSLVETEILTEGTLQRRVESMDDTVFVSLESSIAQTLGVGIGDELIFDVQGVPVTARVGSVREVEWRRVRPNFFVIFPAGVLEQAPQFHVVVARVDDPEVSATVQRDIVARFANVSAIDLTLILDTMETILDRISFVIRFMALFSIITGLTVLAGAVLTSRSQRVQESVLLRTLGASRIQISRILLLEYALLGGIAALTGILLAIVGGGALAIFVFDAPYRPDLLPLLVAFLLVIGLTIGFGRLGSRNLLDRPPLAVLRGEG